MCIPCDVRSCRVYAICGVSHSHLLSSLVPFRFVWFVRSCCCCFLLRLFFVCAAVSSRRLLLGKLPQCVYAYCSTRVILDACVMCTLCVHSWCRFYTYRSIWRERSIANIIMLHACAAALSARAFSLTRPVCVRRPCIYVKLCVATIKHHCKRMCVHSCTYYCEKCCIGTSQHLRRVVLYMDMPNQTWCMVFIGCCSCCYCCCFCCYRCRSRCCCCCCCCFRLQ